jgi:low temperature requirement protein LtrA
LSHCLTPQAKLQANTINCERSEHHYQRPIADAGTDWCGAGHRRAALHATTDRAAAFAIAYGLFRIILAARYALAAHYVREARQECTPQSIGFALAGTIWIVSAAVPEPSRFWMRGAGFGVDLLTPFASSRLHQIVPPDPEHIEERFGTFINISLGEGFVGLVEAMRDKPWSGALLPVAALSLLIGFSIWWGFFDTLDQAPVAEVRKNNRTGPYKISIFRSFRSPPE